MLNVYAHDKIYFHSDKGLNVELTVIQGTKLYVLATNGYTAYKFHRKNGELVGSKGKDYATMEKE